MILEEALARIVQLEAENAVLRARLAQIERQLGLNSQTSSKPPSSDGLQKPVCRTQSLRQSGERPSGGQAGHPGETLKFSPCPDAIQVHPSPELCPLCGTSLDGVVIERVHKRQVFDLPRLALMVTEYQVEQKTCGGCQQTISGTFPTGVNSPTQYGTKLRAFASYLHHQHFIPEDRVSELMGDVFDSSFSPGSLGTLTTRLAEVLTPVSEQIAERVKAAAVKHCDETGMRIAGQLQWLHVVSTTLDTWYRVSPKRKAIDALDTITGVVVHDHWNAYFQIPGVSHGLCNAHHLRELYALSTIEQETWAGSMSRLLQLVSQMKHRFSQGISEGLQQRLRQVYDQIVARAIHWHEGQEPLPQAKPWGRVKRRVGHNLALRLRNYVDTVLRCLSQPEVPFTNNQAERDLRMMKLKQKISGGFRSAVRSEEFACIRSVLSTARKRGMNLLQLLETALLGDVVLFD